MKAILLAIVEGLRRLVKRISTPGSGPFFAGC